MARDDTGAVAANGDRRIFTLVATLLTVEGLFLLASLLWL